MRLGRVGNRADRPIRGDPLPWGVCQDRGQIDCAGDLIDGGRLHRGDLVIKGIKPKDQVVTMLAAQMAATHMAIMTFVRRLADVEYTLQQDGAERTLNKLSRTFIMQMDALKRYLTGGEQKVTVQHVSVAEGGQAIVGNVTQAAPKTAPKKIADKTLALTDARQPAMSIIDGPVRKPVAARRKQKDEEAWSSAQYRPDAVEPTLRGQNALGQALHVSSGQREKTLPDAWRSAGIGRSPRQ